MKQKNLIINLLNLSSIYAYKGGFSLDSVDLTNDDWWDNYPAQRAAGKNDFGGLNIGNWEVPIGNSFDNSNSWDTIKQDIKEETEQIPKKSDEPEKNTEAHQRWSANKVKTLTTDQDIILQMEELINTPTNSTSIDSQKRMQTLLFLAASDKIIEKNNKIDQQIQEKLKLGWGQKSGANGGLPGNQNTYENTKKQELEIEKLQTEKTNALSSIPYLLNKIWDYGCWCYFGEHRHMAQGLPQNRMDKACKALNLCYECTQLDYKKEGNTLNSCRPGEIIYNRPTASIGNELSQDIMCEKANEGNNCKINTCKCETQFISTIIDFFFDVNYNFEPEYQQSEGFNYEDKCQKIELPGMNRNLMSLDEEDDIDGIGNGNSRFSYDYVKKAPNKYRTCCGEFPNRVPYNTKTQQCCYVKEAEDNIPKIFLPNKKFKKLVCCDNGKVKEEGKCDLDKKKKKKRK